jgi:Tfp pilus assembly protein PilF
VSLISEALKEAQKERSGRAAPRAPAAINDTFFPYPSAKKESKAPSRGLVIGLAAFAVVAIGGAAGVRYMLSRPRQPKGISAPIARVAPPPVVTPTVTPIVEPPAAAAQKPKLVAVTPTIPAAAVSSRSVRSDRPIPVSNAPKTNAPAPVFDKPAEKIAAGPAVTPQSSAPATRDSAPVRTTPPVPATTADDGVKVVVNAVTLRPGDSLFARAYQEHSRGNLELARDLYERALARPPVAPELYNNYGILLTTRGSYEAAIQILRRGTELSPDDARIWISLGDAFRSAGRRAEAVGAYSEAAKRDPNNGIVKARLAVEYVAIGDVVGARRWYEEAVRVDPREASIRYDYGTFLLAQKDYRGAIREYDQFVDLAPGKYSPAKIDEMKAYVSTLRKRFP